MKRHTPLFISLLVPLWLLTLVATVELAVRFLVHPPRQIIAYDPILGWRYLPNVIARTRDGGLLSTNAEGFRGPETREQSSGRGHRVLVLGDSYTAGMHVADNQIFTALLANASNRSNSWDVRNGAAPAWATDQELLYFEREGMSFRPSVVVLVVVPNDIRENFAKGFFRLENSGLLSGGASQARLTSFDRLTWSLLNQSALAQWLGERLGFLDIFGLLSRYYRFTFPVSGRDATDFDLFLEKEPQEMKEARTLFEALLLRLRDRCREQGTRLVVTVLPTLMEFSWPLIGSKEHKPGIVSERVKAFTSKEKIEFLDLVTPALEMGGDARSLFLEGDFHLNTKGHAFVAKRLGEHLRRPSLSVRKEIP